MNLNVTESAIDRISQMLKTNNDGCFALRIQVNSGGCSGFAYDYSLTKEVQQDDYVKEVGDFKVVVDEMSKPFLDNATVDFIKELGASYFQISNPNASAKCGCGNSFDV